MKTTCEAVCGQTGTWATRNSANVPSRRGTEVQGVEWEETRQADQERTVCDAQIFTCGKRGFEGLLQTMD